MQHGICFNFQHCDIDTPNGVLSSVNWDMQSDSPVDEVPMASYDKLNEVISNVVPRKRYTSDVVFDKSW